MLLIVLDTVRAQSLSLYGHHRNTTPNLDRLASSGVVFDYAIAPASWTLPTHASIFTGRMPGDLDLNLHHSLNNSFPTIAEAFSSYGYNTAGFVGNLVFCGYEHGLGRGFTRYEDYETTFEEPVAISSLGRSVADNRYFRRVIGLHDTLGRKSAANVNGDFLHWLTERDKSRPFFAFLNYFDAHEPYLPPPPYDTAFTAGEQPRNYLLHHKIRISSRWDWYNMPQEEIDGHIGAYEGAIAYLDHELGSLFDQLSREGLLENTTIIITSDHGEEFGEHDLFGHGNALYMAQTWVPLVIFSPSQVPGGVRIPVPVNLVDLPATMLDLAGIGSDPKFSGPSLAHHWRSPALSGLTSTPAIAQLTAEIGTSSRDLRAESLLLNGKHYIRHSDGREELYDVNDDLLELSDIAHTDKGKTLLPQFRSLLHASTFRTPMT